MSKKTKRRTTRSRQIGCGKRQKSKSKRCHCAKCMRQSGGNVGIGANLTSWVTPYFTDTLPSIFMGVPAQPTFW